MLCRHANIVYPLSQGLFSTALTDLLVHMHTTAAPSTKPDKHGKQPILDVGPQLLRRDPLLCVLLHAVARVCGFVDIAYFGQRAYGLCLDHFLQATQQWMESRDHVCYNDLQQGFATYARVIGEPAPLLSEVVPSSLACCSTFTFQT